jgi:pyridoxamine 5'-phosphate oxidase
MKLDPVEQFARWFDAAKRCQAIEDATAMCLSTVDLAGFPDGRMVLLKEFDARGFVFYTNLQSVKGRSLKKTPRAALTFYWEPLKRQVRIQGKTEKVSDEEADVYWRTRPRLSQLGAWASKQSEPLTSRAVLVKEVAKLALKFGIGTIPRPPYWTGVRVIPRKMEFWEAGLNRLHDRLQYVRSDKGGWTPRRVYP